MSLAQAQEAWMQGKMVRHSAMMPSTWWWRDAEGKCWEVTEGVAHSSKAIDPEWSKYNDKGGWEVE